MFFSDPLSDELISERLQSFTIPIEIFTTPIMTQLMEKVVRLSYFGRNKKKNIIPSST